MLAAGDLAFQNKAQARMKELMSSARVMVLVAHDLNTIQNMCNRAVWMQHGAVVLEGPAQEVVPLVGVHDLGD